MTAASNSEARKRHWERIETELRFVDQHGKEFWTDDAGRVLYEKPETQLSGAEIREAMFEDAKNRAHRLALEQACESSGGARVPETATDASQVAKNHDERHSLPGEGCE